MKKIILLMVLFSVLLSGCAESVEDKEFKNVTDKDNETQTIEDDEIVNIYFSQPESFIPNGLYEFIPEDYENDNSYISFSTYEKDESVLEFTEQDYHDYLIEIYKNIDENPVEIQMKSLEVIDVDGSKALKVLYHIDAFDYKANMMDILVVADYNYEFVFEDDTPDNKWAKEYEDAVQTIDFTWKSELTVPDYSGLFEYDDDMGFTVKMPRKMTMDKDYNGYDIVYYNDDFALACFFDSMEGLIEDCGFEGNESLYEYEDFLAYCYDYDYLFDEYGNDIAVYEDEVDGVTYTYMDTALKTDDGFWLFTFSCDTERADELIPLMDLYASSLKLK